MPQISPKYEVAIDKRIYEITDPNDSNGDSLLVGIPNVAIKRQSNTPDVPTRSVATVSIALPTTVKVPIPEKIKQTYLEVREMATKQVVTAIEILSPVNKRSGDGRITYLKKRQSILGSLTHLVEIDLLRKWEPMPILDSAIQSDYRVLVSRSDSRPFAELYAFNLRDSLPVLPLPLREEDVEPIVNLPELFAGIYDRAGYDYRIDYDRDPVPSLLEENRVWAKELLQETGLRDN
ncbi:MAG: DUF4058 family protein [Microcoleus sp. PH2017_40_RAT_O_B]|uniref:DUF4058 family protein n=1 Tax=unclassified Microcoleus TaxID=2642155 RepID=UPI001DC03E2F|nr:MULTISPECIES: DUF4058 family protein [unclassified Microcoleus]TAE16835.1 MAG: DUF4058 family protein [Oscillatoriales cyanobacterium]MCC3572089.1 DUF4058 family protein [Microcoleus sp. PH2017_34_RAT_O_A]MCC3584727.1 DUF4058 family protein [Microcoleus sp. PH2017_30_WIL_O_A]MCC3610112.1 DUF4058 family protein [Microcoleus sp. PH2017_40_RAT_O_B]TAE28433.1 MAG: DUF4058 family protein [Oscillatoriales cyanobacterium]